MKRSKLILAAILIILLSVFLSGCYVFDSLSDMFCCDVLIIPLPIAVLGYKLFAI